MCFGTLPVVGAKFQHQLELKELQMMQNMEVLLEISSKEEVQPEEVISTRKIKDMLAMWEKVSSFIEKKHPEKASSGRASHFLMTLDELISVKQKKISFDRFLRPASDSA